jgi:high-affinity Fe2+/Pb2+ permease
VCFAFKKLDANVSCKGAGLLSAGNSKNADLGQKIIIVGLFIQIVAFGVFISVAVLFHARMNKNPTLRSMEPNMRWQKHLYVLYFVSLLIMIRSLVRVVEYVQGNAGYILSHEIFLYIFDGTLMFVAVAVFNVIHPKGLLSETKYFRNEPVSLGSMK